MADIKTTLHPENDSDTNLYPNIVSDNIPSGSVTKVKLSDDVNSLLNNIGKLVPSGTDTSTNILAYTENKGIYVATDDGHWYYWDGSQYVDGGVYQATQIADGSISYNKLDDNIVKHIQTINQWNELWEIGNLDWNTGLDIVTNNTIRSIGFTPVEPSTEYYMLGKAVVYCYDSNKDFVGESGRFNLTSSGGTFTTTATTKYVRFRTDTSYGTTYNYDMGINYPSSVTDYHTSKIGELQYDVNNLKNDYELEKKYLDDKVSVIDDEYVTYTPFSLWGSTITWSYLNNVLSITGSSLITGGVKTSNITPDASMKCKISFDWSINTVASNTDDLVIYMVGVQSGSFLYSKEITISSTTGHFEYEFDPTELYIYHSDTSYYFIIRYKQDNSIITLSNIYIRQNKMIGSSNYDDDIWATFKNIDNELDEINTNISNINVNEIILSDYDGTKYEVGVNNGQMVLRPVIPSKALFCGNSLMFGWSGDVNYPFGMCASAWNKDYYYLVTNYIASINSDFTSDRLYISPFESATTLADRQTFITNNLTPMLSNDIDFVSIQMGDNVTTDERKLYFYDGADLFVKAIRENCPRARIFWMAEWYVNADISEIQKICNKYDVKFIYIQDLRSTSTEGTLGQTITYKDGTTTTVTQSSQATHPGDEGMRLIANKLLYLSHITDDEEVIS